MRLAKFIVIAILLTVSSAYGQEPASNSFSVLTLSEAYKLALKQSESVAIQAEAIKEAEGRFLQSLSGIMPSVNYVYSERRQDGRGGSNFTLREVPESKFTFSQPLFSGFKEFAAMKASRAEQRQRKAEKKRAEELLFIDVSDAFYFFKSYQEDAATLGLIQKALAERVEELKKREELGRSRASEVASAELRLSRIEADVQGVLSDWEVARQLLEFLIGRPVTEVADDLSDFDHGTLENYLVKMEQRSDVKAAYEAWQSARHSVAVAKSGFWPTVTADGNYYQKRVGNSNGVDWDATLTVTIPLFKGGENIGLTKEARSVAHQEELRYQEAKRLAVLDIRNVFIKFEMSFKRRDALAKALEAAEKNYVLQKEDYQRNLVNNLDVLQSLEDLEDARRSFSSAESETKRLYWNLKVAAGEIHDVI